MVFNNRTRKFWSEVASIRNSKTRDGCGVVKNREGLVSKNKEEFLEFWADFWEILYSKKDTYSPDFKPLGNFELNQYDHAWKDEPSFEEFENVLKTIAKNKSPGLDRILVEEVSALNETKDKIGLQILHE